MRIAIIEIMPAGHFTLVESIVRIFTVSAKNEIVFYTHTVGKEKVRYLKEEVNEALKIEIPHEGESFRSFLSRIASYSDFDRIYITTLNKYFKDFLDTSFNSPVHLVIHDIDEWFRANAGYRIGHILSDFSFSKKYLGSIKQFVVTPFWKKKIIGNILRNGGKAVVLSGSVKKELMKDVDEKFIEVLPFSVFNPGLQDKSAENKKLRVCIPGVLSTTRRDYFSVFKILGDQIEYFRDTIELDLLGKVGVEEEGLRVVKAAEELIRKGLTIHLYGPDFIQTELYDAQLAKADVILGTTFVQRDIFSFYGKTKETGIPFAMIHAAKPGLLLKGMIVPEEISSSSLFFEDYRELEQLLKGLITDREKLKSLREKARNNSLHFHPANILNSLMQSG